jgi:hypothetical protein
MLCCRPSQRCATLDLLLSSLPVGTNQSTNAKCTANRAGAVGTLRHQAPSPWTLPRTRELVGLVLPAAVGSLQLIERIEGVDHTTVAQRRSRNRYARLPNERLLLQAAPSRLPGLLLKRSHGLLDSVLDSLLHHCVEQQLGETDLLACLPSRFGAGCPWRSRCGLGRCRLVVRASIRTVPFLPTLQQPLFPTAAALVDGFKLFGLAVFNRAFSFLSRATSFSRSLNRRRSASDSGRLPFDFFSQSANASVASIRCVALSTKISHHWSTERPLPSVAVLMSSPRAPEPPSKAPCSALRSPAATPRTRGLQDHD